MACIDWQQGTGSGGRSLVESCIDGYEHLIGATLRARAPSRQQGDAAIAIAGLDRMTRIPKLTFYLCCRADTLRRRRCVVAAPIYSIVSLSRQSKAAVAGLGRLRLWAAGGSFDAASAGRPPRSRIGSHPRPQTAS